MDEWLNPTVSLLVQKKLISYDLAHQCQQAAQTRACRLLPYLISKTQICPKLVAQSLATHFGFSWIDLEQTAANSYPNLPNVSVLLQQHHVLPIFYQEHYLVLAIDDPNAPMLLNDIQFLTQCPIIFYIAPSDQLNRRIEAWLQNTTQHGISQFLNSQKKNFTVLPDSNNEPNDEKPIVAFVEKILQQAISYQASDLHFEPHADYFLIRYRYNGILFELARPLAILAPRITSRLKIMANLDITEKRLPQDGSFSMDSTDPQNRIDCRVNSCPTIYGEKIAIRFLNTHVLRPDLHRLGLSDRDKMCLLNAISRPQGLILVTGPTGSGKTFTLYAALEHLNNNDKNICSVEDPVEIKLAGINQVQINSKIGLSFAEVLRAFLRQDPDIIMLGEIRDYETADIAMKAAHTGHLVLATLHTQNCAQTLLRLKQLGIASFLMSQITLILTQRLCRILCDYCKIQDPIHPNYFKAQGCHRCHGGYQGRKAIFEVMPISPVIQDLLVEAKLSIGKIIAQASLEGMLSLKQAAMQEVIAGVTTLEEIHAIT